MNKTMKKRKQMMFPLTYVFAILDVIEDYLFHEDSFRLHDSLAFEEIFRVRFKYMDRHSKATSRGEEMMRIDEDFIPLFELHTLILRKYLSGLVTNSDTILKCNFFTSVPVPESLDHV